MSDWGTEVMQLGRVPGLRGTGAIPDDAPPPDWGYLIGSYVGAWVGGAAIGYVVGKDQDAAVTGGMAASGVWGVAETIAYARRRHPLMSGLFVAMGSASLVLAWRRR